MFYISSIDFCGSSSSLRLQPTVRSPFVIHRILSRSRQTSSAILRWYTFLPLIYLPYDIQSNDLNTVPKASVKNFIEITSHVDVIVSFYKLSLSLLRSCK